MYEPGIDLVVINYRTPGDLDEFLQSYESFRPTVEHSIVVGNVEPEEADLEIAAPYVSMKWPVNCGYARAVNWCSLWGNREVVGIFNADTILTEGLVNECHNALVSNESWGVIGPRQTDGKGRITHAGHFGSESRRQERGFREPDHGQYTDVSEAISVAGSAYFIKRRVWDELTACVTYQETNPGAAGAFLPTQHYFEDTFCSYHARAHGYQVVYYGAATMIHKWHQASPRTSKTGLLIEPSREMFRAACDAHGIDHE